MSHERRAEKWREKPNFVWLISSFCWCLCFQLTLFPIYLPLTFNEFNQQHQNDIHNDDKVDTLRCALSQALKALHGWVWGVRVRDFKCEHARIHRSSPYTHIESESEREGERRIHTAHACIAYNAHFELIFCVVLCVHKYYISSVRVCVCSSSKTAVRSLIPAPALSVRPSDMAHDMNTVIFI